MTLRAIGRLVLPAAVAMAFVSYPCQQKWKRLINFAAQHFEQPILYDFRRFATGLRNLVSDEQLQSLVANTGYG
jgi:hypothetical protein